MEVVVGVHGALAIIKVHVLLGKMKQEIVRLEPERRQGLVVQAASGEAGLETAERALLDKHKTRHAVTAEQK
jgi:hypothetical protein